MGWRGVSLGEGCGTGTGTGGDAGDVGVQACEEAFQDACGEIVGGHGGGQCGCVGMLLRFAVEFLVRLGAPGHEIRELFPGVHDCLHSAMADAAVLAPAFAVGGFGDVGLGDGEEGEVVALAAVEAGAEGEDGVGGGVGIGAGVGGAVGRLMGVRRVVDVEKDVLDGEGGDDVDNFGSAGVLRQGRGEEDAGEVGGEGEEGHLAAERGDGAGGWGEGGELEEMHDSAF